MHALFLCLLALLACFAAPVCHAQTADDGASLLKNCHQVDLPFSNINIPNFKYASTNELMINLTRVRNIYVDNLCRLSFKNVLRFMNGEINNAGMSLSDLDDPSLPDDFEDDVEEGNFIFQKIGKYDYAANSTEFKNCISRSNHLAIVGTSGECYVKDWPAFPKNPMEGSKEVLRQFKDARVVKLADALASKGFNVSKIIPCYEDCLDGMVRSWAMLRVMFFGIGLPAFDINNNMCQGLPKVGACYSYATKVDFGDGDGASNSPPSPDDGNTHNNHENHDQGSAGTDRIDSNSGNLISVSKSSFLALAFCLYYCLLG